LVGSSTITRRLIRFGGRLGRRFNALLGLQPLDDVVPIIQAVRATPSLLFSTPAILRNAQLWGEAAAVARRGWQSS
jgi:hypothetical protein